MLCFILVALIYDFTDDNTLSAKSVLELLLVLESDSSVFVNPFQPGVAIDVETSHLFCSAKQMTGFYMKTSTDGLTGAKWAK